MGVPEVEGHLFLKSEGKKVWKKYYFVLRASGLYYCPKGKSSRSSKDLVCLTTLEVNQVCVCVYVCVCVCVCGYVWLCECVYRSISPPSLLNHNKFLLN